MGNSEADDSKVTIVGKRRKRKRKGKKMPKHVLEYFKLRAQGLSKAEAKAKTYGKRPK
jgi:predicted secreted protein